MCVSSTPRQGQPVVKNHPGRGCQPASPSPAPAPASSCPASQPTAPTPLAGAACEPSVLPFAPSLLPASSSPSFVVAELPKSSIRARPLPDEPPRNILLVAAHPPPRLRPGQSIVATASHAATAETRTAGGVPLVRGFHVGSPPSSSPANPCKSNLRRRLVSRRSDAMDAARPLTALAEHGMTWTCPNASAVLPRPQLGVSLPGHGVRKYLVARTGAGARLQSSNQRSISLNGPEQNELRRGGFVRSPSRPLNCRGGSSGAPLASFSFRLLGCPGCPGSQSRRAHGIFSPPDSRKPTRPVRHVGRNSSESCGSKPDARMDPTPPPNCSVRVRVSQCQTLASTYFVLRTPYVSGNMSATARCGAVGGWPGARAPRLIVRIRCCP